jgi:tetratricopeptide (TPR) repeat protein
MSKMKSGIIWLTLCLPLVPIIAESQKPPPPPPPPPAPAGSVKINKADSLFQAGKVRASVEEFRILYALNKNDREIIYNYACALSRSGQADSSLRYLYKAVKIEPSFSVLTDPDLLAVRDPGLEEFENE